MKLFDWRNDLLILSLLIFLAAFFAFAPTFIKAEAAAPPVEECEAWKDAGGMIIYLCENDSNGDICYVNAMMLFCLRD